MLDDPWSYPRLTSRYRRTVVLCSGPKTRYVIDVFHVVGGEQQDLLYHAAPGNHAAFNTTIKLQDGPDTLLPPNVPYLANARAEDGRWFVQSLGQFQKMRYGLATAPGLAILGEGNQPGVRMHLLGDQPFSVVTGQTPRTPSGDDPERSFLMIRRGAVKGAKLESSFVTVFDPTGPRPSLAKVGRMAEASGFVVLYLQTPDGDEHVVVNLHPGTERKVMLADGRELSTDAFVVRARRDELMRAGGTVAGLSGVGLRQSPLEGRVLGTTRQASRDSLGWFDVSGILPADRTLSGRFLRIRHADGTTHGWSIAKVEPMGPDRSRIYVQEDPGFEISQDGQARYHHYPTTTNPAPHTYSISTIRR